MPVSKCFFSVSETTFSQLGIRFSKSANSNGLEKKRIHINDAIIVFLFNCIFFVNTAIAKSITIQVMGEIRKSRIFDK
jgi:hypothetical protein